MRKQSRTMYFVIIAAMTVGVFGVGAANAAIAQEDVHHVLVELFTSQG